MKKNDCLNACRAKCCRYVAVEIDKPTDNERWENIYWFLTHENVFVYVDKGQWYVQFNTKCRFLNVNKCDYYDARPAICREHNIDECENSGRLNYDEEFFKPEDLILYIKKNYKFKHKKFLKKLLVLKKEIKKNKR